MPDITMCSSAMCPLKETCYRSPASGTKPSEYRQAHINFYDYDMWCDYYWPVDDGS